MNSAHGRFLAVIPARAGSKRIPRKNIREFHGVPILGRTLETAIRSAIFDKVVVSTDDPEIERVGRAFGAIVPFTRPAEISDDWTGTAPVIAHSIEQATAEFGDFTAVCCIYPGAVLMTEYDYVASSQLVDNALAKGAVVAAVVRYGHPIQRALKLGNGGLLVPAADPAMLLERTQDYEPMWHDAGQFYWASPARWQTNEPLLSSVIPFEVPSFRVQDIDTEDDWTRAELIYGALVSEVEGAPRAKRN